MAAIAAFARHGPKGARGSFVTVRLRLARYLGLALELQLAADILSTAIAPSWEQIGKLAVIALIRTGLNYFLMLETRHEEDQIDAEKRKASPPSPPPTQPSRPAVKPPAVGS
ncbi:DUF1622 domain-containing protein [Massilia glaciei]|uniref:DUF1622 domain-containing protein n=1 Tax=Massilia glaciei TaxID=1524097 RepID=UPI001E625042|nr:DUF1622 domain-containing protein [Massilia glaciei]